MMPLQGRRTKSRNRPESLQGLKKDSEEEDKVTRALVQGHAVKVTRALVVALNVFFAMMGSIGGGEGMRLCG
jgi:hypothetical protein